MKDWTPFRSWVHNLWLDNSEEHTQFNERPYLEQEYFNKYKYWLKREFRHQQKAQNGSQEKNI